MNPIDRVTAYIRLVVSNILLFSMIYGIWNVILSIDFYICQDGFLTTNQIMFNYHQPYNI